jgi:hypothetical protein
VGRILNTRARLVAAAARATRTGGAGPSDRIEQARLRLVDLDVAALEPLLSGGVAVAQDDPVAVVAARLALASAT